MPSSVFAALALKASAAVDAVMAEPWTLQPRKAAPEVTAPRVPDTSRAPATFAGTFVDPQAKPDLPNSYDRREVRRPGEDAGHPRLLVSPAAQAAQAQPFVILQGDLLVRGADGVTWSVASVFRMAGGTLKLLVTLVG